MNKNKNVHDYSYILYPSKKLKRERWIMRRWIRAYYTSDGRRYFCSKITQQTQLLRFNFRRFFVSIWQRCPWSRCAEIIQDDAMRYDGPTPRTRSKCARTDRHALASRRVDSLLAKSQLRCSNRNRITRRHVARRAGARSWCSSDGDKTECQTTPGGRQPAFLISMNF